ncbi:MAG: Gfo/Idh/MocA family oxidoreductase [Armatimonadaceae bacterium]
MNSEEREEQFSRREWLANTGRLAAGVGLMAAGLGGSARAENHANGVEPVRTAFNTRTTKQQSANDKLVLALIGAGGMGRNNMNGLMNHANVEIAAVCDPDTRHMAEAAQMVEKKFGKRPAEIKDFRKVLEMKDVDGVIIGTPDHWHALPTIMACQAGKDVFLEKPISHNIEEGIRMVEAARKYNRVIQVNTWQRSVGHFCDAVDYVRSGKLGKIKICRAWKTGFAGTGKQKPKDPPAELDYDLWVGPAAYEPYQDNRCHFQFRWYYNYAGGMTGDWGVHMIDTVLLGMNPGNDFQMPQRIACYGGKWVCDPDDDRTTPDTQLAIYQFPEYALHWEVSVSGRGVGGTNDHGAEFVGTDGRIVVDRGGWTLFNNKNEPQEKPKTNRGTDHQQNWIDAVKSRKIEDLRSEISSMHQTTAICHLANLALMAGHELEWDGKKQEVTNDRRAKDLLPYRRSYRKPWSLPRV